MRELTINESTHVAGSAAAELLIGAAVITTGIIIARICSGLSGKTPHIIYEPRITETRTPVYDAYGRYEGDMVDTYTTYDPVIVYS